MLYPSAPWRPTTDPATHRRRLTGTLLLAAVFTVPVQAQDDTGELAPITVDSSRIERSWTETPAALGVVDTRDAQQGRQQLQLDESLNRIPGLFLQNRFNFAQDLRISIRGFGARSAFGIRGVKLIVDGIPETLVDGQAQTDIVDLTAIEQIEVIRGPSSALYGNATGGVIDIETFDPPDYPLRRLRLDAGSDGYHRQSAQAGHQHENWGYFLSAYNLGYDGFREHNESDKRLLNGKFNVRVLDDATLRTVVRLLDAPDTQDPGALTRAEAIADPSQARQANIDLDSRQSAEQQTLGLVLDNPLGANQNLRARLFYTHRDFVQYLPFGGSGVVAYDRAFFGGGLQWTRGGTLFGFDNQLTAGVDLEFQHDDRQRFDNVAGDKGAMTFDQKEQAESIGLFVQNVLSLSNRLDLTTGLRFDDISFEIEDAFVQGGNPDDSGERSFSEFSGTLGMSYAVRPNQNLYATIGTAFETPTFTEFADPDGTGGFNPALQPQEAINYEIGARGFVGTRMRYELALFRVEVDDELVVFQSAGGRDFFENSGESRRQGVEAQLVWDLTANLSATGAFTYSDFEFEQFRNTNGSFGGSRLPGIPESQFFGELAYRVPGRGFVIADFQVYDELFADNANQVRVAGYGVANLRIGMEEQLWQRTLTLYAGVNNVLDEDYFSNIRINAFGGRFFETAAGRNLYVGAKLSL